MPQTQPSFNSMTKIYTKLGDQGKTSLINGVSLDKDDMIFDVIGNIDELNASIGITKSLLTNKNFIGKLQKIQGFLFQLSGEIADKKRILKNTKLISDVDIESLEKEMDEWNSKLAPLNNFLFPGSNKISALLHFSRTVCRRTERSIVKCGKKEKIRPQLLKFINRLSDWLFVLARITSSDNDKIWKA